MRFQKFKKHYSSFLKSTFISENIIFWFTSPLIWYIIWVTVTLRGLNFVGIKFHGSIHPRNFYSFADGPFRNILGISRMELVQNFSPISPIDKAVLETGGWNKKNKNQLRNNNDFYVWEISQCLRFVSNKDCISSVKFFLRILRISLIFQKISWVFNFAVAQFQIFHRDLILRFFLNPRNLIPAKFNPLKVVFSSFSRCLKTEI